MGINVQACPVGEAHLKADAERRAGAAILVDSCVLRETTRLLCTERPSLHRLVSLTMVLDVPIFT